VVLRYERTGEPLVRTANLRPYPPYSANNWKQVQFGEAGWRDKVEFIKQEHIDPLLTRSVALINAPPFYVSGMAMHVRREVTLLNKGAWVLGKLEAGYNLATGIGALA
jgi:hypothetical protein